MSETELGHRPLVTENNKFEPLKQIYNGYEIEKRYIMATKETDHTKRSNALEVYDDVLQNGTIIKQGYIKDFERAKEILDELEIDIEFRPNTIRFRQYGNKYILTVKNRQDTKKREVEWELTKKQFFTYWKDTKGSRIEKKRLEKKIKGYLVEIDAFTDRFLLIAEIEVDNEKELTKVPILGMDVTNNSAWTNKTLSR